MDGRESLGLTAAGAALAEKGHAGDYVGRRVQYLPEKLKP